METAWRLIVSSWQVLVLMAPYLLLGFSVAGVMSVVLSAAWVRRHMGRPGLWQVIKAALLGIPLPLCSCAVVPVAFSLRRNGASKAATVAFLAATPQTGVDSVVATWGVLGPIVTFFRVMAALVSGVVAGMLVVVAVRDDQPETGEEEEECECCHAHTPSWRRMLRHAYVTLPRDIARPLLFGVLVSGVLTVVAPADFLTAHLPAGWGGYAVALLLGIPMYVCSTASIPLAAALIHMGASPGAAMAFLISGPATNFAGLAIMWARIGKLGTALYLLAIMATAVGMGVMMDRFFPGVLAAVPQLDQACAVCGSSWWGVVAAVALLAMLLPGVWRRKRCER
jgi:hypothetical protein